MPQPDQTLAAIDALHARKRPVYARLDADQTYAMLAAVQAARILTDAAALTSQAGTDVDAAWARNGRPFWPPPSVSADPMLPTPPAPAGRAGRDRDGLGRG